MPSMMSAWPWHSQASREEQNDIPVGLKELAPVDGQASINVVLIHDITGGRNGTWSGQSSEKDGWYALLTKAIQQTRVFTFGYDSSTMTELSDMVDPATIKSYAEAFLSSLENRLGNQNSPPRESITGGNNIETTSEESLLPLVIVAHGYGGLIYERALEIESLSGGNFLTDHFQLVFLLGTPHYDTGLGEWAILCAKQLNIRCANNAQSQKWTSKLRDSIASIRETQKEVRKILVNQDEIRPKISITGCFASLPVPGSKLMMSPDWAVMPEFTPLPISVDHFGLTHLCRAEHGSKEIAADVSKAIAAVLTSWKTSNERPSIIEHTDIGEQHKLATGPANPPSLGTRNMIEGKLKQAEELDQGIEKLKMLAAEMRQEAEQLYQKQHVIEEGHGQHPPNIEPSKDFQPNHVKSGQMPIEKRELN